MLAQGREEIVGMRVGGATGYASPATRVLVVDDDDTIRLGLRNFLQNRGFEVQHAEGWSRVRSLCATFSPDAIVMDHVLGDGEGVGLLSELRSFAPEVPVVILTGHGSIDLAVRAMQGGAAHFLTKPVEMSALEDVLRKALTSRPSTVTRKRSGARDRVVIEPKSTIDPFVGPSAEIRRLREQAEKVRDADRPLLILGETGTGKSVLARWLHECGPRAQAPFVDLNCAALSRELLDSELFGHERGAFTGAQSSKTGLLEAADHGTLFLDEVGDMDLAIQPKLLKALEERRFRRLGDVRDRSVDIRLISATHQDLGQGVRAKSFRADLYFRISALRLTVPSLRNRREDIPFLAEQLLEQQCAPLGRRPPELTRAAIARLQSHDWPGNVRELKNVLERALCHVTGDTLDAADLSFDDLESEPPLRDSVGRLTLKEYEAQLIEQTLREEGGRVEATAKRLGMPRSSLYYKIKTLGLKLAKN
jgi:DNA-binding NtrC family response regulator